MRCFFLLITTVVTVNAEFVVDDPTSIINGDLVNIEEYPFYVYLRRRFDEGLNCGGSLIRANIVLTAAHCLVKYVLKGVYVGITTEDDLKEAETYEIDDFLVHPLYDPREKIYDMGLIRLAKDVVYGVKVQPIELADFTPAVDEQVTVIGFGVNVCDYSRKYKTCLNPASTHLRKGIMNVTSTDDGVISVVSAVQVACYGDSGGPMIYDDKLVGVASTVNMNNCTQGNRYMSVDEYIPWIQEYIDASESVNTTKGDLASIEDYPFYVYLRQNDEQLICGGSLIQPNIVVTSAHCFGGDNLTVYVGVTTQDDLKEAERYEIDDYLVHPQYNANQKIHDIALIRLTEDVFYGPKVQPIEVAGFKPPVRKQVTMIGFGKIVCELDYYDDGTSRCVNQGSTHLRKATMDVFETDERLMKVAARDESNNCYGEMGDPVIYDGKLIGVATNVDNYFCSGYTSYLPIDEYIYWIQEYIDASNTNGTIENTTEDAEDLEYFNYTLRN